MNLPENLSATATKLYELLSNSPAPKSMAAIASEMMPHPAGEERYKAISTADSLVVKGVLTMEKAAEQSQPDFYTLAKSPDEVGPSEEADANEEYGKKTDTNEEEKRMMAIFEKEGHRLPATELFDLYLKEQSPGGDVTAPDDELTRALQELTNAGLITAEGESYQVKE